MALGLVGTKLGMTRVFTDDGISTPVTVIEVLPNRVTQVKNTDTDGYSAVQVTTGSKQTKRVNSPQSGHYKKAVVEAGWGLWEFRVDEALASQISTGDRFGVTLFSEGQKVDVRGVSIGKGFAGVMKRHGFGGGRATHGNSKAHRKPGSIGQNQTPSRVFPNKKMAGHMGSESVAIQNLEVVKIDPDRSLILIKGAVPGSKSANIIITAAVKKTAPEIDVAKLIEGDVDKPDSEAHQESRSADADDSADKAVEELVE